VNDELRKIWKKATVFEFEVFPWSFHIGIEESHGNFPLG
jgi:hypothetical protein